MLLCGCKVNQYETDKLKEQAEQNGYKIVDFNTLADIYCINSCSVTNMSQRKSRQMIGHARHINPNAIIAVIGCAVESAKENLNEFNADILVGNKDKENFINILNKFVCDKEKKVVVCDISKESKYSETQLLTKAYDVREAVKIEDGCNNFCSYCIIPYLRGRVRSKLYSEIEQEVKALVKQNVKEIVLVGIEVASYGKDIGDISLIDIIERLNSVEGLERIRLSSLEPRYLTEENISRMSKCDKLCDYFHISMQSGSTDTLKRMNRKYDKNLLVEVTNTLRKYFPDCYVAADCIVGFPAETEEEFGETKETIQKMNLSDIHVFKYSKRAYTRAAKMDGQIDGNIKKRRSEELIKIAASNKEKFLVKHIGIIKKVLFESYDNNCLQGYTTNYIKVNVKGDSKLCGTIQDVVLTSLDGETMQGNLV